FASSVMNRRAAEFGLTGQFNLSSSVKDQIKALAAKGAGSHMNTILDDLLAAVRQAALDGASRDELVNALTNEFADITKTRADVIAHTETNRAFTLAQYEADRQFLAENDLTAKAFKKLVTRSANPCPFCLAQAARPAIPFDEPFAKIGDVLTATV